LPTTRTSAMRVPLEAYPSNTHPPIASGVAITHSNRLPNASHQARIVRTSRMLGARPPIGCVCMNPITSPRVSSRRSAHFASAATLATSPQR
jgi:hypothetical protein